MSKYLAVALALICAGLMAAPAMAQGHGEEADDVGVIHRGGGENGVKTSLGSRGLTFETDGFSLRVSTRVQFRFTHQQEVANGEDGTNGRNFNNFRVRRAKTNFAGHIFRKEFQYNLLLSWVSGANIVEVATFRWAADKHVNLNVGQHKMPFAWEEFTSSGNQQFTDRGYVNNVFTQTWGKGIWVDGQVGDDVPLLRYWAGIYNGRLRADNDFRNHDIAPISDTFSNGRVETDLQINIRVETHPLGRVAQGMNDMRGEEEMGKFLVAVGLGINYFGGSFDDEGLWPDSTGGGNVTASGRSRSRHETWALTLDANLRWHGASVFLALFYRDTDFRNRGSNSHNPSQPSKNGISGLTDMGISLEVAYFIIPKTLNVGIRWNHLAPDKFWGAGSDRNERGIWPEANEIGVSANYYLHGNNLKVTLDILHVAQRTAVSYDGSGILRGVYNSVPDQNAFGGSGGSDFNNLWIMRVQLQWIF